jgi:hypothetical protein
MGREVRRVPADWQHPKISKPNFRTGLMEESYQPMFERSFADAMNEWYAAWQAWERGERPDYCTDDSTNLAYWEWDSPPPDPAYYMPQWPDEKRTHYMMYEDTSEGTPISPAFATPEELAHWLVDNKASAFGSETGSYEGWLRIARGGWACSMVVTPENGLQSGVEAFKDMQA